MTPNSRELRLRSAFRRLWTTMVLLIALIFGLLILRVMFWPPQPNSDTPIAASGFLVLLSFAMAIYVAFCIWYYMVNPVLVLLRDVPQTDERHAAMMVMSRHSVHCGLVLGVPMAVAMAYDLPPGWSSLQLLLLLVVYTYLKRYRGPAVTAALARIECAHTE